MKVFHFRWCLPAGCGDLRRLWPAPAGRLPLPPPGHSHRPLLQVQVQQRGWRPVANLTTPSELERRAASRMGHLFFLFTPLRYLPPTSFERFICFLGWACTSPSRFGIHRSAWERHGRKAILHLGLERGAGSKVRGGQTCLWTAVSVCVRRWWFGDVEEDWATSSGPQWRVTVVWCLGGSLQTKEKSELKMLFSCMDVIMQEPP